MADIGDIILYRGKKFGAKVTRGMTHSTFDHVAMILKFESEENDHFIFEATGSGVTLIRWSIFRIFKNNMYDGLFFRHLYCDRNDDMLDKLEKFLKIVYGNKYHISLGKLMKRGTTKETLEQRKFFCSELVAKALKEIGLLKTDYGSHKFYPSSFSQESDLVLENNAQFGDELMITFDEKEIEQLHKEAVAENQKKKADSQKISNKEGG
mmetsp:Transcript_18360/g.17476  ORF Transcript_18360/g.17476 Transcript_18360/m.17476 type:complete len:209 (-) Transcript_18360:42-668(-)